MHPDEALNAQTKCAKDEQVQSAWPAAAMPLGDPSDTAPSMQPPLGVARRPVGLPPGGMGKLA